MQAVQSFAPLAAKLAAKADEIRPADGAKVNWANFVALFWCAIFQMLIALCEALDARAAAVAAGIVAAPRDRDARPFVAAGLGRAARPTAHRAPRLALVPKVQAIPPARDIALSRAAEAAPVGPRLAWSRHPGPAWAVTGPSSRSWRETRPGDPGSGTLT